MIAINDKRTAFSWIQKKRTNKETAFGTHFCTTSLSVEHQVYCMTACYKIKEISFVVSPVLTPLLHL